MMAIFQHQPLDTAEEPPKSGWITSWMHEGRRASGLAPAVRMQAAVCYKKDYLMDASGQESFGSSSCCGDAGWGAACAWMHSGTRQTLWSSASSSCWPLAWFQTTWTPSTASWRSSWTWLGTHSCFGTHPLSSHSPMRQVGKSISGATFQTDIPPPPFRPERPLLGPSLLLLHQSACFIALAAQLQPTPCPSPSQEASIALSHF